MSQIMTFEEGCCTKHTKKTACLTSSSWCKNRKTPNSEHYYALTCKGEDLWQQKAEGGQYCVRRWKKIIWCKPPPHHHRQNVSPGSANLNPLNVTQCHDMRRHHQKKTLIKITRFLLSFVLARKALFTEMVIALRCRTNIRTFNQEKSQQLKSAVGCEYLCWCINDYCAFYLEQKSAHN